MLKIYIHCIKDGEYPLELSCSPKSVNNFQADEFFGNIELTGKMIKVGNRFTVTANVSVNCKFICDRSLTEYEEVITAEFVANYLADTKLYLQKKDNIDDDREIYIPEDEKYLDVTNEAVEALYVSIPMKKVAPEFRDKSIDEIFPEIQDHFVESDTVIKLEEKWSKLKDLKLN